MTSILYCVIGVLCVLLVFMCCKLMSSTEEEDSDNLPYATVPSKRKLPASLSVC